MTRRKDVQELHQEALIVSIDEKMSFVESFSLDVNFYSEYTFGSQTVFNGYTAFREMTEVSGLKMSPDAPRKVMKTPKSQFNFGGSFTSNASDHRNEIFRFCMNDTLYVKKGRAMQDTNGQYSYVELSKYKGWLAQPISLEDIDA